MTLDSHQYPSKQKIGEQYVRNTHPKKINGEKKLANNTSGTHIQRVGHRPQFASFSTPVFSGNKRYKILRAAQDQAVASEQVSSSSSNADDGHKIRELRAVMT